LKTIYLQASSYLQETNLALCLGFFDGLHLAHIELLKRTILEGKKRGIQTGMMTFSTHILSFIYNSPFEYLSSIIDKTKEAEKLGFDYFYVLEVTDDLVSLDAKDFIHQFLVKQKLIVVGFDYTYGKYGKGDVTLLTKQKEFETIIVSEMVYDQKKIGSTHIRQLIKEGNVTLASVLLGRPYSIYGKVVPGKNRGKSLGFPTANIKNLGYLQPLSGVYIVNVIVNHKIHHGLANIGDNPTFDDTGVTLEVYIFDFEQDIYGSNIKLCFLQYLREEVKFSSKQELIDQMVEDEVITRSWFEKREIL